MVRGFLRGAGSVQGSWLVSAVVTCTCLVLAMAISGGRSRAYTAYSLAVHKTAAIPAFARKYGLACSACHTAWPELNAFGQRFRDNGYQLMNDRDSPIWQNPSYIPVTFRITPNWHRESATKQPVDATPGNPATTGPGTVTVSGFDLSGMDLWTAGTLYKNISFVLLPSSDNTGSFHFEAAFVRFDNLWNSHWVNFKFGKFELDNLVSEKRFLFLSGNGGAYQAYHFGPVTDTLWFTNFGLGTTRSARSCRGILKTATRGTALPCSATPMEQWVCRRVRATTRISPSVTRSTLERWAWSAWGPTPTSADGGHISRPPAARRFPAPGWAISHSIRSGSRGTSSLGTSNCSRSFSMPTITRTSRPARPGT